MLWPERRETWAKCRGEKACSPGDSSRDLFGMVSSRDPSKGLLVTSNVRGSKGHGLNHLAMLPLSKTKHLKHWGWKMRFFPFWEGFLPGCELYVSFGGL